VSIDNMITLSSGALKIQTVTYDKEKTHFRSIRMGEELSKVRAALALDKRVLHATRRTQFLGQLSNYDETIPCWHGGR